MASWAGDHAAARGLLERSLADWRLLDDPEGIARTVCASALAAHRRGDEPGELLDECLQRCRGFGAPAVACYITLSNLAEMLPDQIATTNALPCTRSAWPRQSNAARRTAWPVPCGAWATWPGGGAIRAVPVACSDRVWP